MRVWWMDADHRWQCAPFLLPEGAALSYAQCKRHARAYALEIVEPPNPHAPVFGPDGSVWFGGRRVWAWDVDQSVI